MISVIVTISMVTTITTFAAITATTAIAIGHGNATRECQTSDQDEQDAQCLARLSRRHLGIPP